MKNEENSKKAFKTSIGMARKKAIFLKRQANRKNATHMMCRYVMP
jgi:hypothetical protein